MSEAGGISTKSPHEAANRRKTTRLHRGHTIIAPISVSTSRQMGLYTKSPSPENYENTQNTTPRPEYASSEYRNHNIPTTHDPNKIKQHTGHQVAGKVKRSYFDVLQSTIVRSRKQIATHVSQNDSEARKCVCLVSLRAPTNVRPHTEITTPSKFNGAIIILNNVVRQAHTRWPPPRR